MTKKTKVAAAMAGAAPVDDPAFDLYATGEAKKPKRAARRGKPGDAAALPQDGPAGEGYGDIGEPLTPDGWQTLERCAGYDENDVDNGRRMLDWFGKEVLHVHEAGWFAWTGTHWDVETGQHAIERCAHRLIPLIKREAALIGPDPEEAAAIEEAERLKAEYPVARRRPDIVKEAIKLGDTIGKAVASRRHARYQFAVKSGDRGRTKAMIDQAEPHRSVLPKVMDSEDMALNTMSGTLRFTRRIDPDCPDPDVVRYVVTKKLHPHNPDDKISKVTAARYDPKATAPRFLRDFERYMPDRQTRDFLQVAAGYTALGMTGEQVFLFLYGDGSNWKSSFTQSIGRALGSYFKPMMYSSISGQNTPSGDKPSPDWARLPGVRHLSIEEVPKNEQLKEELIKMITSGSDMPVRHLNKGLFDMRTTFTAWMLSNAEPNITGADHGIWRRTLIVQWDTTIPEAERRPFDQVMQMYEAERDGILNWIVEGIEKYLASGLKPYITPAMRAFQDSVRRDRDAVGSFVEDCVEVSGEDGYVAARALYRGFVRWCGANGVDPVPTETAFGRRIKRVPVAGVPMEKRKRSVEGMKRFYGIRMHSLPPDENAPAF